MPALSAIPAIHYTITSGTPTEEECIALETALRLHEKPLVESASKKSSWAKPALRKLPKQNL